MKLTAFKPGWATGVCAGVEIVRDSVAAWAWLGLGRRDQPRVLGQRAPLHVEFVEALLVGDALINERLAAVFGDRQASRQAALN